MGVRSIRGRIPKSRLAVPFEFQYTDRMKNKNNTNKSYNVIGSYMDSEDVVNVLEGNSEGCAFTNGINGDGSDETVFTCGIEVIVKAGIDNGIWEAKGNNLVEVSDDWDSFWLSVNKYIVSSEEEDF